MPDFVPVRQDCLFGLVIALLAALAAPAARADRHCLPSQHDYFDARQALLDRDESSCDAAMTHAQDALERGIRSAEICGCTALIDEVERLSDIAASDDDSCDDRARRILADEEGFEDLIFECHH